MSDIEQITLLLHESITDRQQILKKCHELIERSECRIDKTNEMIGELVKICDGLSEKYIAHIDQLAKARDELIKSNIEMTKVLHSQQMELARERERYNSLVDRLIPVKGTTVNVKQ